MPPDVILRTLHLGKQFKGRWAARDVNLEIHRGDVFGFLGPNGAGKSTTIRMILSLIRPTAGTVELFGYELVREREKALARVAGIVEKPDFYLYLSAYRNMEIAGALTQGTSPPRKKILHTLEIVALADRAFDRVKTYSHGMKQRLGIAQALLCDPEFVVLDEPTNGLDPQGMKEVRELIHRLSGEHGMTIFLSSHLLNEVQQVATRMAIIHKGTVIVQGGVKELLAAHANRVLLSVEPKKKTLSILKTLKSVRQVSTSGESISAVIDSRDVPSVVASLVKERCKVYGIEQENSLEEYFLSVTQDGS